MNLFQCLMKLLILSIMLNHHNVGKSYEAKILCEHTLNCLSYENNYVTILLEKEHFHHLMDCTLNWCDNLDINQRSFTHIFNNILYHKHKQLNCALLNLIKSKSLLYLDAYCSFIKWTFLNHHSLNIISFHLHKVLNTIKPKNALLVLLLLLRCGDTGALINPGPTHVDTFTESFFSNGTIKPSNSDNSYTFAFGLLY